MKSNKVMAKYIPLDALIAEIERKADIICQGVLSEEATMSVEYFKDSLLSFLDTLEVKEVDVSNISENLAEANEYLDYTSTGNLAHNKPMVSARLKEAIRGLFEARLFELTHDKKYRMENLGLKAQKVEEV